MADFNAKMVFITQAVSFVPLSTPDQPDTSNVPVAHHCHHCPIINTTHLHNNGSLSSLVTILHPLDGATASPPEDLYLPLPYSAIFPSLSFPHPSINNQHPFPSKTSKSQTKVKANITPQGK